MRNRGSTILASALATACLLAVASGASAQSITGLTANKNVGNSANADNADIDVLSVTSTTGLTARYAGIALSDVFIGNVTATLTADYNVNFTVNAPGDYSVGVATSIRGGLTCADDTIIVPFSGNADVSAVTGSVTAGPAVASGSLSLADPVATRNTTGSAAFGPTSNSATIHGTSAGSNVSHGLRFQFSASANSSADECAAKIGLGSSQGGQGVGGSPGNAATDGHFVTLTLTSYCGNGALDAARGEQCDSSIGGTTCCTTACRWASAGTSCRAAAGDCDVAEVCPGGAGGCPADTFQPVNTVCRAASPGEVCDETEVCDGVSATCPADGVKANGTLCRASAGVCDLAETCDGSTKFCPGDAKSTAVCRPSGGVCDIAESCNGVGNNCPTDLFVSAATVCRSSGGLCDVAENCTGSSANCPTDAKRPNGFVCDAGSGDLCDPSETCDGSTDNCPADTVSPGGTVCRPGSGDICDPDETCTGAANQPCPANVVLPPSTVCNPGSGDLCDPDQFCPGVPTGTCAADVVAPPTTVCRFGTGDLCDPDEYCTGSADTPCPSDFVEPNTTVCNPGSGDACDPDEFCPGVPAGSCAADVFSSPITVCRGAAGDCDAVENCPGSADGACPADGKIPNGTTCRGSAGICDVVEACDGLSDTCPSDAFLPNTTTCRADAGICDVAETCTGSSAACPSDSFEADGFSCTDGAFCNGDETCQSGTCSPGTSPCSMGENCDEGSQLCFVGQCPNEPTNCVTALKSKVLIKNKADDTKDKLVWKWTKGGATVVGDFADPTTTAQYALCFYEGATSTLIGAAEIAPGSNWSPIGTKGYKYKDTTGSSDGVTKVLVKSGANGKSKALVKGKGANLPDFTMPLDTASPGVVIQLRNNSTGKCLTSAFTTPKKNDAAQFKAKNG
jgi:hypothetical protein